MTVDANDYHRMYGLEALRQALAAAAQSTNREGSVILDAVHAFLGRFIAYPSDAAHVAHTLWIAHTHAMDAWYTTPRIAFLSPEPASGKSRALEVSALLVPGAVHAVNTSPAYLFRKVGAGQTTLLYDEIDTVFGPRAKEHEDIRALLNAGHHKSGVAGRCTVKGKSVVPEEIPAYCALAMAGLGDLPDTLMSRSIVVRMRRRAPGERVDPFRDRDEAPAAELLATRLAAWAATRLGTLGEARPVLPPEIADRNADIWEPLLAIADAAGGEWPKVARVAAVALVADARGRPPSLGIRLLTDLKHVFGEADFQPTDFLLQELIKIPESPWGDIKGKPLDARGLAVRLRSYEIKPVSKRIEAAFFRGYLRADLKDSWERYLAPPPDTSATSATSATESP
ncbi:MAG: DUF3631 domain-containing protein [Bauldia sp.]